MKTVNPMQLKALIKKKAAESHISAQLVMQNYMMERLLERISLSKYRRNFIFKGGFLIAAIVGLNSRATRDMDATIKGFPLTHEAIRGIFDEICAIPFDDNIELFISRITDIRERDDYPGLRLHMTANYPPLTVALKLDVSTGDKITPGEVEYSYKLLFNDRTISILAYNLETILAEKLETVLSRNIANTRSRDFYDIFILYALRGTECDMTVLRQALNKTALERGSLSVIEDYREIIKGIAESSQLISYWMAYQDEFDYAKGISFNKTCNTILRLMESIIESTNK
jgi:predicted nucleotidyltransferase component of viral defense system